jgi:type IV pilus assembly protein PilW
MAIFLVVMQSIYSVFVSSNRSYHTQENVVEAQQGIRMCADYIERDIRMAGFDPTDSANAGIEVATATKLRFTADMNRANGIEETDRERVTYEFDVGNNRVRQGYYEGTASETWQTLLENVNSVSFSYLDVNDAAIALPVAAADLDDIRTVVLSMTVQGTNAQGGNFFRTLDTRIRCRNM